MFVLSESLKQMLPIVQYRFGPHHPLQRNILYTFHMCYRNGGIWNEFCWQERMQLTCIDPMCSANLLDDAQYFLLRICH